MEGKYHPWEHRYRLSDEDQITREGVAWSVSDFAGTGWFKYERMWCVRLSSEDRTVLRHWRFKASGVDALVRKVTLVFALLFGADADGVSEDVSKSASEDVAFVGWHL